jgi:chromosome segregation ATPase
MATQLLTYDELATAWGVSREAARKKVEGLRLPKQMGNDGKARIMIDLIEVQHQPLKPKKDRRPPGDRSETEALRQHVETLRAEVERHIALAATIRGDFERERDKAERALNDLVSLSERLADAEKERAEKLVEIERAQAEVEKAKAELSDWKARPWWRRALGA